MLNPPYISPHLPKMYRMYREFLPYLAEEDITALVRLEITEYARRPKLAELRQGARWDSPVAFPDIQTVIREKDRLRLRYLWHEREERPAKLL